MEEINDFVNRALSVLDEYEREPKTDEEWEMFAAGKRRAYEEIQDVMNCVNSNKK